MRGTAGEPELQPPAAHDRRANLDSARALLASQSGKTAPGCALECGQRSFYASPVR